MDTMCEVCGDVGFKRLLVYCRDCTCSAAHQYCLEKVVFDASLADWVCYECRQKRGEISCNRSLKIVSCQRAPSHAQSDSTVHESVTKRRDLSSGVGLWTNRKSNMVKNEYLNKLLSSKVDTSQKKHFKRKPDMEPVDNCSYKRRQIAINISNSKSLQSCETIGSKTAKGNNGGNLHIENGSVTLNIRHPKPLIVQCLGDTNHSHILKGIEGSSHQWKDPQPLRNPFKSIVMKRKKVVLGSKKVETSTSTADYEKPVHEKCGNTSGGMMNMCANMSSQNMVWTDRSYHGGKTIRMATCTALEESEDVLAENRSLELDNLHAVPRGDYILSRTSCLSEAQKERVMAFIQKTKPQITVFVSVIGKSSVQPPGPYLGISKEYAFAYFPHESTKITLQMPGMDKMWHPLFYKRKENRKNFIMGRWMDFVRDNNVQEGDICLLEPVKEDRRSTFTVYLLRTSAMHATDGDGFLRAGPYPSESIVKMASEVHVKGELSKGKHVSAERLMHESSHESPETSDTGDPIFVPYIAPCRHDLSKSQKKIIDERVRAIQSKVPIYLAVMKNNNAGHAQRWMLEIGVRYAAEYLPAVGQTVVLQRMGKTWNTQMVIHNGRRWFLNGGWTKFARDNGLRVRDVCLFELMENERNITMNVHIIFREEF